MENRRVLIGSPVHQKPEILKEFLECLSCLSHEGVEIDYCFVDDNNLESSRTMLAGFAEAFPGAFIIRAEGLNDYSGDENTHYWNDSLIWKVAAFKDLIIQKAAGEAYDYLFLVDSDILIYNDTLQQLIAGNADIISEIFWTKWYPDSPPLPNVWLYDTYDMARKYHGETLSSEESEKRSQDFLEQLKIPGVYEVGMLGACTLISRRALTSGISFKRIQNITLWGEDRHFCVRASALGFKMYVDTSRPAFHIFRESLLKEASAFKISARLAKPAVELDPYPGISCPICCSKDIRKFHDYAGYTLLECRQCGLIFRDPAGVKTAGELISGTYGPEWVDMRDRYLKDTFLEHAKFNNMLLEIFMPGKGSLLEIGSGTGEFLYLAKCAGWEVYGVEPGSAACRYAEKKFGLSLVNCLWSRDLFGSRPFDAIAFWHVLEHMPNPVEFLTEAAALIKTEGLIFFSLPNRNSLTNEIYGANSPLFTEEDHLIHFTRRNLLLAVEKAGLKPVTIFSRQEPGNLEANLSVQSGENQPAGFEQLMSVMAGLQADFRGHELVCIAKKAP